MGLFYYNMFYRGCDIGNVFIIINCSHTNNKATPTISSIFQPVWQFFPLIVTWSFILCYAILCSVYGTYNIHALTMTTSCGVDCKSFWMLSAAYPAYPVEAWFFSSCIVTSRGSLCLHNTMYAAETTILSWSATF